VGDLSDHFVTFLQPNLSKNKNRAKKITKRFFTNESLNNFKNDLQNLSWREVLQGDNVDDCYELFWNDFKALYDLRFPIKSVRFNRNVNKIGNFMTRGLLISRKNKLKLQKQSLTDPSAQNIQTYRDYRNLYNKLIRTSKKISIGESIQNNAKNPKKTWDILKEVTSGQSKQEQIDKIMVNDELVTDPDQIANEFNKFFSNVGVTISQTVEQTEKDPISYLNYRINTELNFGTFSQADFINIVDGFSPKDSSDYYGISNKLLKFVKYEIATPLSHIFNLSFNTGKFPTKLKISRTVPIFKAGDRTSCDNYRPISLLCSLSKVLEKAAALRLVGHLRDNQLLNQNQFGFQEKTSTVHHLAKLTNFVTKEINNKNYVVGIFLDLKKAFDVVPHSILLKKLEKMGIVGLALRWFTSYLEGRNQCVDIAGNLSSLKEIVISVLQGSILGPILFLCYINDLPDCTDLLALLFADDTAGLTAGPDLKTVLKKANVELKKIATWFRANKMAVNVSKTKFIVFKPKGMKAEINEEDWVYYDNNEPGMPIDVNKKFKLERVSLSNAIPSDRQYKLLGVFLDEHLSFDFHVNSVCNKIAKSNYIISKAKNLLPLSSLKTLYYALVHPHLLYCLPIYACTSQKNLIRLQKAQKKSIRIITRSKYNEHTTPLFNNLKIMPFDNLVKYTQSLLVHSIIHKYCPPSLHNTWSFNHERNPLMLRNAEDLYIPLARSDQASKLPYFAWARLWNELPPLKLTPVPTIFRPMIKDHFLTHD
jgi:hypothetical protein